MSRTKSAPLTVQAGAKDVVLVVDAGVELIVRIVSPPERDAGEAREHAWLRAQREGRWQVVGSAWAEKDAGGTRMAFAGVNDPADRKALILYLESQSK